VCGEFYLDSAVTHLQVRMMIFLLGDLGHSIEEGNDLLEISKLIFLPDGFAILRETPTRKDRKVTFCLGSVKGGQPPFTRPTPLLG